MKELPCTITIAGIKHSGKSTLGKRLAQKCNAQFYDTDDVLAAEQGKTVREIFRELGAEKFRRLEADVILRLAQSECRKVISLGGGAVTNDFISEQCWEQLGIKIMVDVSDEVAEKRVFANGIPAYLEKYSDPVTALREINLQRRKAMRKRYQAVYEADGNLTPEQQADRFHSFLEQKEIL